MSRKLDTHLRADREHAGGRHAPASCRCRIAQDVALRAARGRVTETDQRALIPAVAPAVEDGLYLVPKVIE